MKEPKEMGTEELIRFARKEAKGWLFQDYPAEPPAIVRELASRLEALREAANEVALEVMPLCEPGMCTTCDCFREELSR